MVSPVKFHNNRIQGLRALIYQTVFILRSDMLKSAQQLFYEVIVHSRAGTDCTDLINHRQDVGLIIRDFFKCHLTTHFHAYLFELVFVNSSCCQ